MTEQELKAKYDALCPKYINLKNEVIYILEQKIQTKNIPYDAIYGRVKTFDSFIKKIQKKEILDPFSEIHDICGTRVICFFLSQKKEIEIVLEDNFEIIEKDEKEQNIPMESFDYLSINYTACLTSKCSGARYEGLHNTKFEIQLRTITEHAWCAVSHNLSYKHPNAIPTSLKKNLYALNALFYLAGRNFEELYQASQNMKEEEDRKDLKQIGKEEINFDTLAAYLKKKLPDREIAPPQHTSLLSEELYRAGYRTIDELDDKLVGTIPAVEKIEGQIYGVGMKGFHNVGVVRNALCIVDNNFSDKLISPIAAPYINRKDFLKYVKDENVKA